MTSITRNLPWFIREPGLKLIGEKCYRLLIEELDITHVECIKYSLSKGLGLGIVVGGSIVKVPQLLLILSSKSARGISLTAYVLETLAYAITLVYSWRRHFPFSTYGENLFLTIQNALITILIVYLPTSQLRPTNLSGAILAGITALVGAYFLKSVPMVYLKMLMASTLPLSVFSKLPQIMINYRAQSTGQLSTFAIGAQVAGCLARLFTTATEVGDSVLFLGFLLALILNCVLGLQMWMYWGKDDKEELEKGYNLTNIDTLSKKQSSIDVRVQPATPVNTTASPRRWARKLD